MHNCKDTQSLLVDLVFEEASSSQGIRVRQELRECAACRSEYIALTQTLSLVDRSFALTEPTEEFWPAYQARLDQRIRRSQYLHSTLVVPSHRDGRRVKLFRAFFTPVRVPVPIAAGFALGFSFLVWLAMRPQPTIIVRAPAPPPIIETRTVEVPVIKERVVTRVLYVDRVRGKPRVAPGELNDSASSLAGFRPPDQVHLTVIKGGYRNEK